METERVMVNGPGQPPPRGERVSVLVAQLRGRIERGLVRPGARLPSVRDLAASFGVSRFTAVEAYDRLVATGWAEARRGSGFYARMPADGPAVRPAPAALPEGPDATWLLAAMLRTDEVSWAPGSGMVPTGWLDQALLSRALRLASRDESTALSYGDPLGLPSLRRALAQRLAELGVPAGPGAIVTAVGATGAVDLIAGALIAPGDAVLVDDPGYFLPFAQLATRGARVIGVPWAGDGPDLAALETLLARHAPRLYLTTASLHNPTGGALAPAKAHRLLTLAEAHGTWIVEDDVYGDLAAHPPPRLAALDGLSRVLHVGSFSKTLAPGWRVGFVAAPEALVPRLVTQKLVTGITSPQPAEAAVAAILADGAYRRHAARLRDRVAVARARALRDLVEAGFTPAEPAGDGMFVWARGRRDAQALATDVWARGILTAPGALFSPTGAPSPWMRINVAAAEHAPLMEALAAANRP